MKFALIKLSVFFLVITGMLAQTYSLTEFRRKVFKFSNITPGIYEIDVGFKDTNEQFVAAFGDLDQSTYTDIIVSDKASKVLSLYTWGNKESSKYKSK
jgi:hypothetical protein